MQWHSITVSHIISIHQRPNDPKFQNSPSSPQGGCAAVWFRPIPVIAVILEVEQAGKYVWRRKVGNSGNRAKIRFRSLGACPLWLMFIPSLQRVCVFHACCHHRNVMVRTQWHPAFSKRAPDLLPHEMSWGGRWTVSRRLIRAPIPSDFSGGLMVASPFLYAVG